MPASSPPSYDAAAGWWQAPLDASSVEKTAFPTKFGLFEFLKMPFGTSNAAATFQRLVDLVLGGLRFSRVAAFADGGTVYSASRKQHLKDIEEVFTRFLDAGISIQLHKCRFAQRKVQFLGFQISDQGCPIDPRRTSALASIPPPTSLPALRSVLGLFSYYRKLTRDCAGIAEPLLALTRTTGKPKKRQPVPFVWARISSGPLIALRPSWYHRLSLATPTSSSVLYFVRMRLPRL